jgi:hypothetical protein
VTAALILGPIGLLSLSAIHIPSVWAATQRLVRFILTGTIQLCDRNRLLISGQADTIGSDNHHRARRRRSGR